MERSSPSTACRILCLCCSGNFCPSAEGAVGSEGRFSLHQKPRSWLRDPQHQHQEFQHRYHPHRHHFIHVGMVGGAAVDPVGYTTAARSLMQVPLPPVGNDPLEYWSKTRNFSCIGESASNVELHRWCGGHPGGFHRDVLQLLALAQSSLKKCHGSIPIANENGCSSSNLTCQKPLQW